MVLMATAKFKAQNENARFLNPSTHSNKSFSSIYSHTHSITFKHFQHWPLGELWPPALLKPAYMTQIFSPSITHIRSVTCIVYSDSIFIAVRLMISLPLPQALLHATCGALKCFPAPYCLREGWIPKHSSSPQLLPSFHVKFDKFLPVA